MDVYIGFLTKMVLGLILILFVIRIMGQKELSQSTPLDIFFIMLLAELLGGVVHTPEFDWKLVIFVILTWALLVYLLEVLTKIPFFERAIKGKPKIIIRNGVIDEELMESVNLTREEVMTQIRHQGVFKLSEVKLGVLEINGNITVKKRSRQW